MGADQSNRGSSGPLGYVLRVGITEAACAKAQAAVSKAEADVAEIQSKLDQAQEVLDGSAAAGDVLKSIENIAVVGSLTSGLRNESVVDQAKRRRRWTASPPSCVQRSPAWSEHASLRPPPVLSMATTRRLLSSQTHSERRLSAAGGTRHAAPPPQQEPAAWNPGEVVGAREGLVEEKFRGRII